MKRQSNSQLAMTEKASAKLIGQNANWRAKKLLNSSSLSDPEKTKMKFKSKLAAAYQSPYRKARVLRQN